MKCDTKKTTKNVKKNNIFFDIYLDNICDMFYIIVMEEINMQYELFTFGELTACALKTASKAFKSCDFDLADKMLSAVSVYKAEQKKFLCSRI